MAIDLIKGVATQAVNTGLRKVAGNIPKLLGINKGKVARDSSDFAFQNEAAVTTPKLYQFPLDTTQGPGLGNHGHYIIFYINEQQKAKLSFSALEDPSGKSFLDRENETRYTPAYIRKNFGGAEGYRNIKNVQGQSDQLIENADKAVDENDIGNLTYGDPAANNLNKIPKNKEELKYDKGKGQFIKVERPPVRRLDTAIAMYMPATVQATYAADFQNEQIGALANTIGGAYADIQAGRSLGDIYQRGVNRLGGDAGKKAFQMTMGVLDAFGVTGVRSSIEIASGEIFADRMELAFRGVGRRSFTYNFKMIPRNQREADEIRKIIFAFKANMLPELKNGKDRDTMTVPNTFNIQYMHRGKENDYLHRVSECFLENVQVSYGGDRYKTFDPIDGDGAPPVETQINLAFKEIEIITRERIFQGY